MVKHTFHSDKTKRPHGVLLVDQTGLKGHRKQRFLGISQENRGMSGGRNC